MQWISILEAATGFAVISLAVTYLITVGGTLERKRAVALAVYHQAREGANVAGYLARHFIDGEFRGLTESLELGARELHALLESHLEHPLLHYFHTIEVHKSLPRILFLALETGAVVHSCIAPEKHARLVRHPAVQVYESSTFYVLTALAAALDLRAVTEEDEAGAARRRRRRFAGNMERLKAAGISTREQRDEAEGAYLRHRERWEGMLKALAVSLAYEWEEIAGDWNLRNAEENVGMP